MQNSLGMNEISALNDGIKQAIQSHIALQQETQQEQVYSLTAPQKQREWNVLLTYETIFSQNLEILQEVVQEGRGDIFPDELQQALQKSVQITVLNFNQLASSLEQSNFPPKILSSLTTVNLIEQALNTLRASGAALTYSLDEMIPLTVVISSMRDMNDNISQLGNDLRKV
jgi:hypothetical protein